MKALTKQIFRFAIPTITSMWIFCLYTMVDGMFIGNYLGSYALGAANIAYPMSNVSFGCGILIAVGSSTLMSIALAERKKRRANYIFNLATVLGMSLGILLSIVSFIFLDEIVVFLGASPLLQPLVHDYLQTLLFFFPFYLCGYGWELYIKVDGNAIFPMLCVLSGAFINIGLDYFFLGVLHTGIRGAAVATGMAQSFTSFLLLAYLILNSKQFHFQRYRYKLSTVLQVLKTGSSEFFTEVASGILILIFNHFAFSYLGDMGVVSYSVINYVSTLIIMSMIGFAQGVQPILSYYFGKKAKAEMRHIFRVSGFFIGALSIASTFVTCYFAKDLVYYFMKDAENSKEAVIALQKYSFSYLFLGFNLLLSSFFTAMRKARFSSCITFLRAVCLPYLLLLALPHFAPVDELWWTCFVAELLCLAFSLYLYKKYIKEILHD